MLKSFFKLLFFKEENNDYTPSEPIYYDEVESKDIASTVLINMHDLKDLSKQNSYFLKRWCVHNNQPIKSGDVIVEIETSKYTLELEAFSDGYIEIIQMDNSTVKIGDLIAKIHIKNNYEDPM